VADCLRCGAACDDGGPGNGAARVLRRAPVGGAGVCPSCHITALLQDPALPLVGLIAARGPAILLDPRVAEQIAAIAAAGRADVPAAAIDWRRVVEHWALPHPGAAASGRAPARR
jgi:hypothetical protein